MFKVCRLLPEEVDAARALAFENYIEAQRTTQELPSDSVIPELRWFLEADGGIAYAAWEEEVMVGYLGFYAPFDGLFGPVSGSFSPLHGHAAVEQNRAQIYSRLYQSAAADLVERDATSHAVVLHASDATGIHSFFVNGFGVRTIDAMRRVERILGASEIDLEGVTLDEMDASERASLLPLHNGLTQHLNESPALMWAEDFAEQEMLDVLERRASRHFVARDRGRVIAYMELTAHGENFMTVSPTTRNICGAFMYKEYRGKGIYTALLDFLLAVLQNEGHTHLGVDFEGFNPTARGFWLKHFTATTYGVTRRIDERILG